MKETNFLPATTADGMDNYSSVQTDTVPPAAPLPERPRKHAHVRAACGDWGRQSRCASGVVKLPVPLAGKTEILVHGTFVAPFQMFLDKLHERGLFEPYVRSISGYRVQARPNTTARIGDGHQHISSWGMCVTINAGWNRAGMKTLHVPYGDPIADTQNGEPGYSFFEGHPVVHTARECGLVWAGGETWADGSKNRHPEPAVFQYVDLW